MYKLNRKQEYDRLLSGYTYYILYINSPDKYFKNYIVYHSPDNAIMSAEEQIIDLIYEDRDIVDEDFEDFYGKPEFEYYKDIREQLSQIEKKDTVVIDVPTLNDRGYIVYDQYVLHKFVKQ